MSELEGQSAGSEQSQFAPTSPGEMLRSARQAAGMHIEALAVALKVPVSKLEALEADNYQVLPDAVFVRALASSVCRSLKIDPAPVLAIMPQSSVPRLSADGAGINAAFKDGTEKIGGSAILASAMHPAFLAAAVLLLGAAVLAYVPRFVHEQPIVVNGQEQKAATMPSELISVAVASAEVASSDVRASTAAMASASEPSILRLSVTDSESPPSPPVPAAMDLADGKEPLLVLRARSESWIQVRDATGSTTLQKILTIGESTVVPGKPPLFVVVGNAEATDVLIRGKMLDLVPVSKDNVARFEVKP